MGEKSHYTCCYVQLSPSIVGLFAHLVEFFASFTPCNIPTEMDFAKLFYLTTRYHSLDFLKLLLEVFIVPYIVPDFCVWHVVFYNIHI